jgi:minor extracellular serine protease Vpr
MRITTWGAPRALGALLVLSLLALLVAAGGSAARSPQKAETTGLIQPAWTPVGLQNSATTVMVQVVGEPSASVEGNLGRDLSEAEKAKIEADLKATQAGVQQAVEKLGGTVVAGYQAAYNGLKVEVARNKTDEIAKIANVVAVRPLQLMKPDNTRGVALIGAPLVWAGLFGLHGEHVKIAVIDTGIDYTHANFGGPGTTAAYNAANATDTLPADASLFGPAAPRVKGGTDLVGDAYDAGAAAGSPALVPHPDPNPLDCNGHGSHVAGSAAGSGVLADGHTYTGTYDANTISGNLWTIGPGVAPKADIYSIRVFGCEGSTDVTVDAIEWAVDNDMDVINMSLGSSFGSADDPSAIASTNAAKAGVIVVASAGNSGPNQYITGSPATADGALSVAANDPSENFPGATITLSNGVSMTAVNANEYHFTGPVSYTVRVITDNPLTTVDPDGADGTRSADESLGCDVGSFGGPLPANTIAVVNRGTCARVAKAIFGQQAGAAAVVMVNNATTLPPVEGPITSNPDDGTPFTVTIPFLGVRGLPTTATSDGGKLRAANGLGATVAPTAIPNTNFKGFADFSSGGPRTGDSFLKPDVTAPGVSIVSTASGSGNGAATLSGTSMASPHAAGVAALTKQAHPQRQWKVRDLKAAIINTADPAGVLGYRTSRGGAGLVQPAQSTRTQAVAYVKNGLGVSLNYGYSELDEDYSKTLVLKIRNLSSDVGTFHMSAALPSGSPHTVTFDESSFVSDGGSDHLIDVTLKVPAATAGASNGAGLSFNEVAGIVEITPDGSFNNGIKLRVPYYFVPRALSDIETKLGSKLKKTNPVTTANITNKDGVIAGDADFYAWGLSDGKDAGKVSNDVRAIGVQSFPWTATTQFLGFSVSTFDRWSNPSTNEFDIFVDVDNNGSDDYVVVGVDQGAVQTGVFNGRMGSFVFSTRSAGASINFFAQAPTDSSTANIFVLSNQLCRGDNPATPAVDPEPCLNAAHPRFTYSAVSFDVVNGGVDEVDGTAKYNAWSPAISTGGFQNVAPGGTAQETIAVNATEWALTPALGLMIASLDDKSKNGGEAQLIPVDFK